MLLHVARTFVSRLTSTRMIHPYQKCPYQVLYNIIAFSDFHYMLQDILSVRCLKRIFQPKVFSKPNQPKRKKTSLYFILMDYHNCLPLTDSLFDVFRDTVNSVTISNELLFYHFPILRRIAKVFKLSSSLSKPCSLNYRRDPPMSAPVTVTPMLRYAACQPLAPYRSSGPQRCTRQQRQEAVAPVDFLSEQTCLQPHRISCFQRYLILGWSNFISEIVSQLECMASKSAQSVNWLYVKIYLKQRMGKK